ncbi:TAXI family TRAP transporter solute-binding subunit [Nocardiopsis sp. CNT-189]|uniref:TAXI family TRAP transporter solute-binding subunit n=1 Tax=Nocardiopsis oceanisediminis TaxID=2816862 RepID=UPI003B375DF8
MGSAERAGGLPRRAVLLGALAGAAGVAAGAEGCARRGTAKAERLTIATGPRGAVFREIGGALAGYLRDVLPGTEIETLATHASSDNLRLLARGEVDIGPTSLDAFDPDTAGVAALCRLYDSYLHLMVPAESGIRELADLDGGRASLGAEDSGTEYTVRRLAELTGVEIEPLLLNQAGSAEELEAGRIDAMFSLTGVPTPAIVGLAERLPLRAVELHREADRMADARPEVYYPGTLSGTAYRGVRPVRTLSVPNVLLARADLPDDIAEAVTGTVFDRAPAMARTRPEAAQINVRTGIATGAVPMHPGAARWFRSQKP